MIYFRSEDEGSRSPSRSHSRSRSRSGSRSRSPSATRDDEAEEAGPGEEEVEDEQEPEGEDLNSEVKPCFMYKDDQVLLEGLKQAKVLTNTIDYNELPEKIVELEKSFKLTEEVHSNVKRKILLSCLLESTQTKLPKRKDPLRPAWNFPRDYGISDDRKK